MAVFKRNIRRKKMLFAFLVILAFITVGYAILNTELKIGGTGRLMASEWNIHFANIKVEEGSVTATQEAHVVNNTEVSFNIDLATPGDFYEFSLDVVNEGTIDAMLVELKKEAPNLPSCVKYTVSWINGEEPKSGDALKHGKALKLIVRVEFLRNIEESELPDETVPLSFNVGLPYVQSDGSEGVVKLINKISGSGVNVGDEVAIKDEHFYVISADDTKVTLLSKYNLLAANMFDGTSLNPITVSTVKQSPNALGWHSGSGNSSNPSMGVLAFSDSNYWVSDGSIKAEYGSSYPVYVFDNNSNLKRYVDDYKSYLDGLNVPIEEARLIKVEEMISLGCDDKTWKCKSAPSWVYSSSYWTGSASDDGYVWRCDASGFFGGLLHTDANGTGIRPVIVVSRSLL